MIQQDKTILVVDDIAENRNILATRLERDGFKVATASNGEEGMEVLRNSLIDLVLLDIMMPEVDGLSMLGQIRAESIFDDVGVVMVTALDNMNVAMDCMRRGACGYITKPYEMEQVTKQIRQCLKMEPHLAYSKDD